MVIIEHYFRLLCGIGAAEIGIPRTRTRLLGTKNLALSSPTNKWHNSNNTQPVTIVIVGM